VCAAAVAQQGSSAQQSANGQKTTAASAAPMPKAAPKVWTEDDVKSLRTPADEYLAQERAQQEAEDEAKQKEAAQEPVAKTSDARCVEPASPEAQGQFVAPKSVDEAQARLKEDREDLANVNSLMERTKEQIAAEKSDQVRAALEQNLQLLSEVQVSVGREIEKLQAALTDLRSSRNAPTEAKPQE
jgi:succinate dehydrogenase/fumarate reductase flavoprotein subunit